MVSKLVPTFQMSISHHNNLKRFKAFKQSSLYLIYNSCKIEFLSLVGIVYLSLPSFKYCDTEFQSSNSRGTLCESHLIHRPKSLTPFLYCVSHFYQNLCFSSMVLSYHCLWLSHITFRINSNTSNMLINYLNTF